MQVAVFGGSFDPPHVGHVLLASYLGTIAEFDLVLVVPVFKHAFAKDLTDFQHRLRMCHLAFERLDFVQVSPIEATLRVPNYTLHTLEAINHSHPDWQLRLAIGSDVLAEAQQWYRFDAVVALAPPYVLARHGHVQAGSGPHLLPDISSRTLRGQLFRRGEREIREQLLQVMPLSVLEYIDDCGIYVGPT